MLLPCVGLSAQRSKEIHAFERERPNIVLIFADDLGYGDLGCYGGKTPTPNLDRLAGQGMRFTDFCVPQAVCSASRAALLTGCYPNRIGILGALSPKSKTALHSNEITLAELLKTQGYATAVYGKWHLGHRRRDGPRQHGFDDYFGLPYSNDMWPYHPTGGTNYPPLPLIEGERVVQTLLDQSELTRGYTERAVRFIEQNQRGPFFLYLPHSMPHVPLFVSRRVRGKSGAGRYGDVLMEIDWSVGEILRALSRCDLDRRTLVVFTSDNGPWLLYGNHAGSAGRLREGKATTFEGGVRVPCLMRWTGRIPAGSSCRELASSIDLLPTFGRLAGARLPADRIIDGKDIWPLLSAQPGARTPHEALYFYWERELQAVRSGPWKLHFPHSYPSVATPGADGQPGQHTTQRIGPALFNLDDDLAETTNLAAKFPEVVRHLETLAERARDDLGDSATQRKGRELRPPASWDAGKD